MARIVLMLQQHRTDLAIDTLPWDSAEAAILHWRGSISEQFARAEISVTETLLSLSASGIAVSLPHLVGERFAALEAAVNTARLPSTTTAIKRLSEFRTHKLLRDAMGHGTLSTTLDRRGDWTALFHIVELKSGGVDRRIYVVTQKTAVDVLASLKRSGQMLGSALGQIRREVSNRKNCDARNALLSHIP